MCLLYDGSTWRLTESGFMEKPGIEIATTGLQDIGLSPTPRQRGKSIGGFPICSVFTLVLIIHILNMIYIGQDTQFFSIKMWIFPNPSVWTVMDAQKNHLIETVLLNTHNICFGWEIRKLIFICPSYNSFPDILITKSHSKLLSPQRETDQTKKWVSYFLLRNPI